MVTASRCDLDGAQLLRIVERRGPLCHGTSHVTIDSGARSRGAPVARGVRWGGDVEVPLSYDHLGGRLRAIGDVPIEYDRLGSRPAKLGGWLLDYDHLGSRLRGIGPYQVEYDHFGSRARSLGEWPATYDRMGTRLRTVGPYEVTYDRMGSRMRGIGSMTITYDRLGSRARAVTFPDQSMRHGGLSEGQLLVLFFVLYLAQVEEEATRE
jgi:hypothetical protein